MFGEMSTLLLTGQQVVPTRAQAQGFVFEHPELEAALRDLLQ
jgi:NAD dependent epimerase/dehydratase family enzyme